MTKEQKILVLLILLVAGGGAALYITTAKTGTSATTQQVPAATVAETVKDVQTTKQVIEEKVPLSANAVPSNISMPYVSEQTYAVPENSQEKIKVTIYVKSGLIEDVIFSFDPPTKHESAEYLSSFKKALAKMDFKGKKVSDISLSRVGGASLTTAAFMKAVQEINGKTGV